MSLGSILGMSEAAHVNAVEFLRSTSTRLFLYSSMRVVPIFVTLWGGQ